MRLVRVVIPVILIALLVFWGCDKQPPVATDAVQEQLVAPQAEAEPIALEAVGLSGWEFEGEAGDGAGAALAKGSGCKYVFDFERQPIARGVAHYKFYVKVGPGRFDRIGIHRVVKEKAPFIPIKTSDVFFFQHGDAVDFEGVVLPGVGGDNTPRDFGFAVFLAENGIDVWGIDQAWALVPEGTTNFNFMKGWGLRKIVDDLSLAIGVARSVRLLTGAGFAKVVLSGYSSGVLPTVALLNDETQIAPARRQVRGYVPVDCAIRLPDSELRDGFVAESQATQALYDGGQYQVDIPFRLLGGLARNDPDGDSPIIPGFTNLQVTLLICCGPAYGTASYHYFSGVLNSEETPTAFRLTTLPRALDFLLGGSPYEAGLFIAEFEAMLTGIGGSEFSNHFSEITVPVFNIAAKGGIGDLTLSGLSLLGSGDIQSHLVSIPDPNIYGEYGHIDLFTSTDAPTKVWTPILNWLKAHRH